MKKTKLLATAFTAALFSMASSAAHAQDMEKDMEKCNPTDKDGKNWVKAGKADCGTNPNKGKNEANDPKAWIWVKKGECEKIKQGDMSDISKETLEKLELQESTEAKPE